MTFFFLSSNAYNKIRHPKKWIRKMFPAVAGLLSYCRRSFLCDECYIFRVIIPVRILLNRHPIFRVIFLNLYFVFSSGNIAQFFTYAILRFRNTQFEYCKCIIYLNNFLTTHLSLFLMSTLIYFGTDINRICDLGTEKHWTRRNALTAFIFELWKQNFRYLISIFDDESPLHQLS